MAKRIGGSRRRTRLKFKKDIRRKGKIGIQAYLKQFNKGDRVMLVAEPAYQKGLYHRRHHGRAGVVLSKRGSSYEVMINDLGKQKKLIVHPVHLKRI